MNLIENKYETALMQQLPPNARDLAEDFFSTRSLQQLLEMLYEKGIDERDLKQHHISEKQVPEILYATLLAKTTYFLPNHKLTKAECRYLITLACAVAGYSLKDYKLSEIIINTQASLPVFSQWLLTFEKLYLSL